MRYAVTLNCTYVLHVIAANEDEAEAQAKEEMNTYPPKHTFVVIDVEKDKE